MTDTTLKNVLDEPPPPNGWTFIGLYRNDYETLRGDKASAMSNFNYMKAKEDCVACYVYDDHDKLRFFWSRGIETIL